VQAYAQSMVTFITEFDIKTGLGPKNTVSLVFYTLT